MSRRAVAGLATLPADEASRFLTRHPELAAPGEARSVLALAVRDDTEAAELTDLLAILKTRLGHDRGARQRLLRALLPVEHLAVSPAVLSQIRRNAAAQAELAAEFGLLTSTDVAELARSSASNPAALASRWRKERKLFAVDVDGGLRFPGYQFAEGGRPRPVIADVLAAFGDRLENWELALWFTGGSGWLGGMRPVDVLDTDSEAVVDAAQRLADEILTS